MDELVRWLGEQLAEDEGAARAAALTEGLTGSLVDFLKHESMQVDVAPSEAHYARHTPARVLREIDAKRQILRALESAEVALRNTEPGREPHELMAGSTNSLRAAVRMLATAYADRPGYREEWRP